MSDERRTLAIRPILCMREGSRIPWKVVDSTSKITVANFLKATKYIEASDVLRPSKVGLIVVRQLVSRLEVLKSTVENAVPRRNDLF
jgi:hypothetical protein